MWDCAYCGSMLNAEPLQFCPNCYREREEMPRSVAGAAPSNAWEPQNDEPEEPVVAAGPSVTPPAPVPDSASPVSAPAGGVSTPVLATPPASPAEETADEQQILSEEAALEAKLAALRSRNARV